MNPLTIAKNIIKDEATNSEKVIAAVFLLTVAIILILCFGHGSTYGDL